MRAEKISNDTRNMVINLLSNIENLKLEDNIIDNCGVLLKDNGNIVGTISYEKYNNISLIRYFVFKKNIELESLLLLYNCLQKDLSEKEIKDVIGIVNTEEVKSVFEYLGFEMIDKEKVYFDETQFNKTSYNQCDVFHKFVF